MLSRFAGAALVAVALVVPLGPAPVSARGADVTVDVVNMQFTPAKVTAALGSTVTWVFREGGHDTASVQGFWDAPLMAPGSSFAHVFGSAGTYPYVCTPHASFMKGTISVPPVVTGSSAKGWKLRWATATGVGGGTFDVQLRKPRSAVWLRFRTDTDAAKATIDPARHGEYVIRARTTVDGHTPSWSPKATFTVR